MNARLPLLFFFIFTIQIAFGQDYEWLWAIGENSPKNAQAISLEIDQEGNTLLLSNLYGDYRKQGREVPIDLVDSHWVLSKYNQKGEQLWQSNLNNYTDLQITALQLDNEGNSFVIGYFSAPYVYFMGARLDNSEPLAKFSDGFIAKISNQGKFEWVNNTGRRSSDVLTNLCVDGMGNAFALSKGEEIDEEEEKEEKTNRLKWAKKKLINLSLLKFTPKGKRLWVTEIARHQSNNIRLRDSGADFEGNFYLAGTHRGDSFGDLNYFEDRKMRNTFPEPTNVFLLKVSPTGEFLWVDQFASVNFKLDEIGSIFVLKDLMEDYTEVGNEVIRRKESESLALLKYDSEGQLETYSTFGSNNPTELLIRPFFDPLMEYGLDGNLYLLTRFKNEALLGTDRTQNDGLYLLRFDSDCQLIDYAARVNDDYKNDFENPLLSDQNVVRFLRIDRSGNPFIAGKQLERYLSLGTRLTSPYNANSIPAIYLAKMRF